jgi:SAM-dependent methyltransferase
VSNSAEFVLFARRLIRRVVPRQYPNAMRSLWRLERGYGHGRSSRTRESVDAGGNPIPWYTYPAFEYLVQFDFSRSTIFEYGSGNSTIWWGTRGQRVVSVERDRAWFERVAQRSGHLPVELHHADDRERYVNLLEGTFDVIIVDGDWRGECAARALKALAPGGLIILDNADWYARACELLRTDLIQVDFSGFGPVAPFTWTTSLFLHREFQASRRPIVRPIGSIPHTAPDDWRDEPGGTKTLSPDPK